MLDANLKFAETLFGIHPDFIPTQALYLDLEGRQHGSEDILSFFWPVLPGEQRFSWITRTNSSNIDLADVETHLQSIGATRPQWIAVYSGGGQFPDEQVRLAEVLGRDPFPESKWINLLFVVQQCDEIKKSITEHRNVWYGADRIQVRNSLEALEWEFGIERSINLRSHSNRYSDLSGEAGLMEVLATAQRSISGMATKEDEENLRKYCEADVKNMYEIAYTCEQLLFSRNQRRSRRRLYSGR